MELPACVAGKPEWESFRSRLESSKAVSESFETACEMCDTAQATVYCDQDKAHLCASCDESHHASSKLLLKHVRVPLYHSPFQFGFCPVHTGDRFECVCLDCGTLLCSLCLLVGDHAASSNHTVVSSIEAFRLSLGDTDILDTKDVAQGVYRETETLKAELIAELTRMHTLVVQAESNHWQVQQGLDSELRSVLKNLSDLRKKRTNFIQSVRRESLLVLTQIEWFESFLVHARLSLPPSVWLQFYHRVQLDSMHALMGTSEEAAAKIPPIESIAQYVRDCLPPWTTARVSVQGFVEIDQAATTKRSVLALPEMKTNLFEWIPEPSVLSQVPVSPESLRKNRMATRVDEFLSPNKEYVHNMFPLMEQPVPLDNVKDFVLQTLAVLAESESQICVTGQNLITPSISMGQNLIKPPTSIDQTLVKPPASMDQNLIKAPTISADQNLIKPPTISGDQNLIGSQKGAESLRIILSTGHQPFGNAVAILSAAPNGEKPDLIRMFVYLFRGQQEMRIRTLIEEICREAVKSIEASNFLISSVSLFVPTMAAFLLFLFPNDATFLDQGLRDTLSRVWEERGQSDLNNLAETTIQQYIAGLNSEAVVFPESIKFLLSTVFNASLNRFPQNVAIGVTTGLFLARIVSPRLLWSAPKSSGDTQAPPVVTLMTRYLHRIAGAAAEGHSTLSTGGRAGKDAKTIALHACISQVNGLLMKNVINKGTNNGDCPEPVGGMTPRSVAAKIDQKMQEYGKGVTLTN